MIHTLVTYFSASGVTKALAERLADGIGAKLYEIAPEEPYSDADLNWMDKESRSTLEMKDLSARPALKDHDAPVADFDVIFVGFPIWWYREPSIIDTFMESYDFSGKTVVPFATSGGSGLGDSARNLQALAPGAKVAEGKRFPARTSEAELKTWAQRYL